MIKVLHLFTTLDSGGVESFLFNYYSHIDRKKIQFDFIPSYLFLYGINLITNHKKSVALNLTIYH